MPKKAQPYSKLAAIYDFVMKHVNYRRWYCYVLEACQRHNVKPERILEIACGTGTICRYLAQDGYRVAGMDLCYGMLAQARQKNGPGVPLVQGHMRDLPFQGRFDLIICLYDSINYLLTPRDLKKFLLGVSGLLKPAGLFIFDICTEFNSLHYFRDIVDTDSGEGFYFERRSRYRQADRIQENKFKLCLQEGARKVKYREEHVQRIYLPEEIQALIDHTGCYRSETCDGFTFDPPTFNTTRIHYLLTLR